MKWLLILTAALVLWVSGCAPNAPQRIRVDAHMQELSKPLPYLVQIFSRVTRMVQIGPLEVPEEIPTWGSAFIYIDNQGRCGVYTNNHLVGESEKTAWVRRDGGKIAVEVAILSRDSFFDMAVLACPETSATKVESAVLGSTEDIFAGRRMYTVGFSRGRRSVATGYVMSIVAPPEIAPYLFSHQSPLQPGDSGGVSVVFNDKNEPIVIGVNTMMARRGLQSYSISARYLRRIMARLWEKKPDVNVAFGIALTNISEINPWDYRDGTGMAYPPHGDVVVVAVEVGTLAEQAGILRGDVIVGARRSDGTKIPFTTAGELTVEMFFQATDETIFLSVIRDGKSFDVAVMLPTKKKE